MNLYDLLLYLNGSTKEQRASFLKDAGVDESLWPHVENCYDKNNRLKKVSFSNIMFQGPMSKGE